MSDTADGKGACVDYQALPANYPTHRHSAEFWESLGRAVATFGFLEEIMGKAILAYSGRHALSQEDAEKALQELLPTLEGALTDSLGGQINAYEKAVKENEKADVEEIRDLLEKLRAASKIRNVICHGSWRPPNDHGQALPFFVNKKKEIFQDQLDAKYLQSLQAHTSELASAVVTSVTSKGWHFPGTNSPGTKI